MAQFVGPIGTSNGVNYLTAVNGGGLGGPDSGTALVALHTDATAAGSWEIFKLILQPPGQAIGPGMTFALQTAAGGYVTAVNGGGIGGASDGTCPVHTDATQPSTWEQFTLNVDETSNPPNVTIQTQTGNYVTAVNGGGVGDSQGGDSATPVRTADGAIGSWQLFKLVNQSQPLPVTQKPTYTLAMSSFQILNTRSGNIFSSSSDTDYASLTIVVNGGLPQTKTQSMGSLRNGVYQTNQLSFSGVAVGPSDNVVLTYLITNSSVGDSNASTYIQNATEQLAIAGAKALANTTAQLIGSAIGAAIGIAFPVPLVGSALGAVAGWLIGSVWNVAFPDCDGPVAAGVHILSGSYLQAVTAGAPYVLTENHPGVNSPSGCGSNSNYNTTLTYSAS